MSEPADDEWYAAAEDEWYTPAYANWDMVPLLSARKHFRKTDNAWVLRKHFLKTDNAWVLRWRLIVCKYTSNIEHDPDAHGSEASYDPDHPDAHGSEASYDPDHPDDADSACSYDPDTLYV